MRKKIISVIIPTLNEEGNIKGCITSLQKDNANEIIVVDNSSKDNTVKIAKKQGAKVISKKFQTIFDQVLTGVNATKNGIIFIVYADSRVSSRYTEHIEKAISQGYDGGSFLLKNSIKKLQYVPIAILHGLIRETFSWSVYADRGIFVTKKFFRDVFLKQPPIGWWDENLSRTIKRKGRFKLIKCFTKTSFRVYEEKGYFKMVWFAIRIYMKRSKMSYADQTKVLRKRRKECIKRR